MIYISLTTVPQRLGEQTSILRNLNSLLNQNTDKEYKVYLNVPERHRNGLSVTILPDYIPQHERLVINWIEHDSGPITKILGILPHSQDGDLLIVCDDDHEYHADMLEYHIEKRKEYPDGIICFRGDIPLDKRAWEENGKCKYALYKTHFFFPVRKDSQLAVPGHWHSVSYKREFFGDDFNRDAEFITGCANDDLIVGYYAKKKRVDIVCVAWDKETDFRPVNDYGRGAWSFPIIEPLPYPSSGFDEHRKEAGDGYGKCSAEVTDFLHNNDVIYE